MPRGGQRLRDDQGRVNGVGERIRGRRRELGLTQSQVCARIEMESNGQWLADRQDMLRIENGTRLVGDLELICVSRALEVKACWLLLGDTEDTVRHR